MQDLSAASGRATPARTPAQARRDADRMARLRAERKAQGLTASGTIPNSAYSNRKDWQWGILPEAVRIVESYDTGVTLRQLFYQLVARQIIPNTKSAYSQLGRLSAEARRRGEFPSLIEGGRVIHQVQTFDDPDDARGWLASIYRRDRTEGQDMQIILGVEKAGIVQQLRSWFSDLGLPIVALGGYSSQTLEAKLNGLAVKTSTVFIYAGDFDPSGQDIVRNLAVNLRGITIDQVALTAAQVEQHGLPVNMAKEKDARRARYGDAQVELDALDPDTLRSLYQAAIDGYWDPDAYDAALEQEAADRAILEEWD